MTIPFVIDNQWQRTVQDNLRLLLQLELVDLRGERRWARWMLKGTSP